jgi:tight adherence protein B
MLWFSSLIEGAGLSRFGSLAVLSVAGLLAFSSGLVVASIFKVAALGLFISLGALAFSLEALTLLARNRQRNLQQLWPEVIDALQSAIVAGLSLAEALDDLALTGPTRLRPYFMRLNARVDEGIPFGEAIDLFKAELGSPSADLLGEMLRLVQASGSQSLSRTLKSQAKYMRQELALSGQIESKQGWVTGTAKIAVLAPWVVVAMLSTRPENAQAYNSPAGLSVLLVGFLLCLIAYRLVHVLGGLPAQPRVFK